MSENKMRILVISDSHGRNDDVAGVIEQVGPIDMLIHCGDVERGDDYICSLVDCPVHMVSGNNDYNLDLPAQDIFNIGDYKVLVVHGHTFYVYRGVERLKQYALHYAWTLLLCVYGCRYDHRRGKIEKCRYCDVWSYA